MQVDKGVGIGLVSITRTAISSVIGQDNVAGSSNAACGKVASAFWHLCLVVKRPRMDNERKACVCPILMQGIVSSYTQFDESTTP